MQPENAAVPSFAFAARSLCVLTGKAIVNDVK
jgi:hypothetical protein